MTDELPPGAMPTHGLHYYNVVTTGNIVTGFMALVPLLIFAISGLIWNVNLGAGLAQEKELRGRLESRLAEVISEAHAQNRDIKSTLDKLTEDMAVVRAAVGALPRRPPP